MDVLLFQSCFIVDPPYAKKITSFSCSIPSFGFPLVSSFSALIIRYRQLGSPLLRVPVSSSYTKLIGAVYNGINSFVKCRC